MAVHPIPPAHGAHRPDDGTLGRAAAIGFAVALGLLRGLGVSYTKVMAAGNEAQKALAALVKQIQDMEKDFMNAGSGAKERAALEKAIRDMVTDLERVMHLTDKSNDWNKNFPKAGAGLHKDLEKFLKHLIQGLANAFGGWPHMDTGEDYFKKFIEGKEGPFDWSKVANAFDSWLEGETPHKQIFTDLLGRLDQLTTEAQSQFAAYSARWGLIRKRIENWIQVTEKAVQIQYKTLTFQINKI